jgi:hypothetical protein
MKTKRKRAKPYRVQVTPADIREGMCGDCFNCAIALALQRATGDDHANVHEADFGMYLEAHSRVIVCPREVVAFVWKYDTMPRNERQRPIIPDVLPDNLRPFEFELPPFDSLEWEERCYECDGLFPTVELNDEQYCPECAKLESKP